ncbi:hypothetical protein [Anaerotignum neopropionicum]|uniref:hypothetical protein n=1 Tax=Anaerotignum neopropionicum TaxID=36847 RepID=UPI0012FD743A|nr:hypothetical protein [Anaerotignum neopropionicum]
MKREEDCLRKAFVFFLLLNRRLKKYFGSIIPEKQKRTIDRKTMVIYNENNTG